MRKWKLRCHEEVRWLEGFQLTTGTVRGSRRLKQQTTPWARAEEAERRGTGRIHRETSCARPARQSHTPVPGNDSPRALDSRQQAQHCTLELKCTPTGAHQLEARVPGGYSIPARLSSLVSLRVWKEWMKGVLSWNMKLKIFSYFILTKTNHFSFLKIYF